MSVVKADKFESNELIQYQKRANIEYGSTYVVGDGKKVVLKVDGIEEYNITNPFNPSPKKKGLFKKAPLYDNKTYEFYFWDCQTHEASWGGKFQIEDKEIQGGYHEDVGVHCTYSYSVLDPDYMIEKDITTTDRVVSIINAMLPNIINSWVSKKVVDKGVIAVQTDLVILAEFIKDEVNNKIKKQMGIVIDNVNLNIVEDQLLKEKKNYVLMQKFVKDVVEKEK